MTDQCPYLEYRPLSDAAGDGTASETADADPRAYCTAADEFVQPMRADICNDRYDLDHETDCELYRDHEGLDEVPSDDGSGDVGERDDDRSDAEANGE